MTAAHEFEPGYWRGYSYGSLAAHAVNWTARYQEHVGAIRRLVRTGALPVAEGDANLSGFWAGLVDAHKGLRAAPLPTYQGGTVDHQPHPHLPDFDTDEPF